MTLLRSTPMPPRTVPLRRTGLRVAPFPAGPDVVPIRRIAPRQPQPRTSRPRRETGFTAAVKLAIRTRAGRGDPADAVCEGCGRWLGPGGGQCHHRINRQMGGSRHRNTVSNGLLLCGTPLDKATCHGRATAEEPFLHDLGICLDSHQDAASVPVKLYALAPRGNVRGGVTVWLGPAGEYLFHAPGPDGGIAA